MLSAKELSRSVNREALRYIQKEQPAARSFIGTILARLALRRETPYPYRLTEDNTMLPSGSKAFGRMIRRDRQSGLVEIHRSLSSQRLEHQWLYVPDAELWIDTTIAAHEAEVASDHYAHIFLSYIFPTVEAVHTHPGHVVKKLAEASPWGYSEHYLLEAAQPTNSDFMRHYTIARNTAPGSHQISSVVSHYGTTSFFLTNEGADAKSFQVGQYDHRISSPSDPIDGIRAVLNKMMESTTTREGKAALSVTFEPMPQLQ